MAAPQPLKLYCATSNSGKLREFRQAAGRDVSIDGLPATDCPETGETFEQNAVAKALCYSEAALANPATAGERPLYLFADDSGIEVDALGGAPGVHSARFSGPAATDRSNNELLLARLAGVAAPERTARFVCSIALTRDGKLWKTFLGKAEGRILDAPRGPGGFGYDPLFLSPPLSRTFAELFPEEKLAHSHRGQAFRRMLEWLGAATEGSEPL
jgi:XTP/dITP diphosphohydrolase